MKYLFAITFITFCLFSFVYNLGEEEAKNDRFLMNNDFVVTKALVWPKSNSNDTKYSWIETDSSVALLVNSKIIWQLNHTSPNGKPYFYPLNTTKGHNLVWLRPDDHPWHYGLWFSWKYINKINYWEEDRQTRISEGKQVVKKVKVKLSKDFSAKITFQIAYLANDGSNSLKEKRILNISPPDTNGNYYIDWSFNFKAKKRSITLDRTLPEKLGGQVYGGYAGLSYRASPDLTDHKYLDSENWTLDKEELVGHGKVAKWMDLTGTVDKIGVKSGVTMFNHPHNGDTPWYVYKQGAFAFFNAGLLFNDVKEIKPKIPLKLRYRVLIHASQLSRAEINEYYRNYK